MNKTTYKVRHIRCNMADFNADRHRFRFEYRGKEYIAACYSKLDVIFDDDANSLPDNVKANVMQTIFDKIDKEENKWRYPEEAYMIANAYCAEEFA